MQEMDAAAKQKIVYRGLIVAVFGLLLFLALPYLLYDTSLGCSQGLFDFLFKVYALRLNLMILVVMLFYLPQHLKNLKSQNKKVAISTTKQRWLSLGFLLLLAYLVLMILSVLLVADPPIKHTQNADVAVQQCQNR